MARDDNDRLDSHFSVMGAFWVPGQRETFKTGMLRSDDDGITLTTSPEYRSQGVHNQLHSLFREKTNQKLKVFHGFTEQGDCTLCDLVETERPGLIHTSSDQSIESIVYRASTCITGMHLHSSDDRCLDSARFTFRGLDYLLPKATPERWGNDAITLEVPLKERDIVDFSVRHSRTRVSVKIHPEIASRSSDEARVVNSVPLVEIQKSPPESIFWYFEVGNRLENLFSLLTGSSLALDRFFVYRGEESAHVTAKRTTRLTTPDIRECVRCSDSQLANSIAIWLSEPHEFRSVESLVLGVLRKGKLFMETEFLSLAQALEGFHRVTSHSGPIEKSDFRKLRRKIVDLLKTENAPADLLDRVCAALSHVNEPTFTSRLLDLCGRMSQEFLMKVGVDEQFASKVVATRNFYTHTGGPQRREKRKPVLGPELFLVNLKMRALLRGVLLSHLGIPELQFCDILSYQATRWKILGR